MVAESETTLWHVCVVTKNTFLGEAWVVSGSLKHGGVYVKDVRTQVMSAVANGLDYNDAVRREVRRWARDLDLEHG